MALVDAAALNNVVGASARLRRAPGYTARRLWRRLNAEDVLCRSKAENRSWLAPRRQPLNVIRQPSIALSTTRQRT